jgi:YVTN family beta-propeller protein
MRAPLALILALLFALLHAPGARADLVYVLNSAEASISVIDTATRTEVRRIPVLREVHHLILTPDRRELMIGDSVANELVFLNPDTAEVTRREKISNPYHFAESPDGKYLVVTSLRRDQVDIYDAATRTLLQRLKVGDMPSHVAYSPDSKTVYVTLQGVKRVAAISLEERRLLWSAVVGPEPAGIIWHNGKLLVGVMGADHVAVMNPADGVVERTIYTGRGAHTVFAAPDGSALYVTSRVESRLTVLDPTTLEPKGRIELPGGPDCIAFDPQGKLWVTLRWVARVAQVDPRTGTYETYPVGRSPHGVWVQPRATPLPPPPAPAASLSGAVIPVAAVLPARP